MQKNNGAKLDSLIQNNSTSLVLWNHFLFSFFIK